MEFYYVETGYVDYLRTYEFKVLQNKEDNFQRPYVGVLTTLNGIKYLIPLASPRGRFVTNKQQFHRVMDGSSLIGVLKFNNMIPVRDELIQWIDFNAVSDQAYKALLQKEYVFIKGIQTQIERKALHYRTTIWNSNEFFKGISNDFTLLEQKMAHYTK
jgi:protein AbiQ